MEAPLLEQQLRGGEIHPIRERFFLRRQNICRPALQGASLTIAVCASPPAQLRHQSNGYSCRFMAYISGLRPSKHGGGFSGFHALDQPHE